MKLNTVLLLQRAVPVVLALLFFALLLQFLGFDGTGVLVALSAGAAGSSDALLQTTRWTVPLLLVGLGAVVSFRSGYFNVGGLGQFYMGAIGATFVGTSSVGAGPAPLGIAMALAAGVLAGALWSLLPGVLRVYFKADEVVTTLMLNFVAQLLMLYLLSGPMRDESGSAQGSVSAAIPVGLRISDSTGVSWTISAVAVVATVVVWVLVNRTSFGVLSGIGGRNPTMLRWQGAGVSRIGLTAFAVTGALGGLAGALEILGPSGRLVTGLSPQIGTSAMLVALTAGLAVGGAVLSSIFFGGLTAASLFLPVAAQLPASVVVTLNGIIAIVVTAHLRFGRWRLSSRIRNLRRTRRVQKPKQARRTEGD